MNAADLKAKLESARQRLLAAESGMEQALRTVEHAERADKSMISAALGAALAETKAARQELLALDQVIADA